MLSLKITLVAVDEVRKILMDLEIMDMDHRILPEKVYGYIGITEKIDQQCIEMIKEKVSKSKKVQKRLKDNELLIEICNKELELIPRHPHSVSEMLEDKLSSDEIEDLKKSFDIIGKVVIVEIPENLQKHKKLIGETTLEFTKRDSVYMKKSAIHGITRTREIEFLSGIDNPITIHKEQKVRLKLDVSKVYFSPRLTTERKRIANIVKDGEKVLDMFAGVGPFPIIMGSKHKVDITAVDINCVAIDYLKENIKLNKLKGNITPICGDINEVKNKQLKGEKFDRILMNLPGTAYEFLDTAFEFVANNGIIHYYEFSEGFTQGIERLNEIATKHNKHTEIVNTRKVRSSSPGMWQVAIDCKVIDN